MATENLTIVYPKGAMEVRGGTPIAQDGTVANNANAYGVLEADIKWPETAGAVIVSGEVNYDWACSNSGIGIIKEAADAMSEITFVQDDGEPYVFPCSGGGAVTDPILENAKETGGIGYTEGEATTITWDGDTSGLVSVADSFYKVSDATPTAATLENGKITIIQDGETQTLEISNIQESENAISVMMGACTIILENNASVQGMLFPLKGVYFMKSEETFISKLEYTAETIHKIDAKYIPGGSGGGLVVNLTAADEETWDSDKTFPEIKQALENGQFVVAKFSTEGKNYIVSGGTLMPAETEGYELIQFMFGASGDAMNCAGNADETVWYLG